MDAIVLSAADGKCVRNFLRLQPVKEEVVDRGTFPAKVLLFKNTGRGWPDVVFPEPNLVAQVADASRDFPQDLTNLVPREVQSNFVEGALAPCTFSGKLLCLRNDIAQNMNWYNAPVVYPIWLQSAHNLG